jgi:hypothetical protein
LSIEFRVQILFGLRIFQLSFSQLIQFLILNWNSRDLLHERLTAIISKVLTNQVPLEGDLDRPALAGLGMHCLCFAEFYLVRCTVDARDGNMSHCSYDITFSKAIHITLFTFLLQNKSPNSRKNTY